MKKKEALTTSKSNNGIIYGETNSTGMGIKETISMQKGNEFAKQSI